MKKYLIALSLFCLLIVSTPAAAARIDNCTIQNVYVGNGAIFIYYNISGGPLVAYRLETTFSDTITNRMLATALTALSSGATVSLWIGPGTVTGIQIDKP